MTDPTTLRAPRFSGLDGLRAIAVTLVVVYHLFPGGPFAGGFLGVDVFFVISGFLITSLLLREHARTGGIRLKDFWRRRARRLLPALAVVVTVCATAAWLVGGDVLVSMGAQVLGAATFSFNWVSIATGADYFAATAPEIFRNLWSLAVEEQFYLLWPLLLPLFLLVRRRWRIVSAAVLAAASAVWAVALVGGGADLTRVYFGTDTHAFGLLLGVALAFASRGVLDRPALPATPAVVLSGGWTVIDDPRVRRPFLYRRSSRVITGIAGVLAVGGIVALATLTPTDDAATYPGVLVAASALTAAAIVAGIWPDSWFGRVLDLAPLRWIGARSYGLYLWHWPVVVLLAYAASGHGPDATMPAWVGIATLVVTLVAAELSYRFVEMPIRRHGFRGAFGATRGRLAGSPRRRMSAVAALAIGCLALGGTSAALASAPDDTSSQTAIEAGQAALDAAEAQGEAGAEADDGTGAEAGEGTGAATGAAMPGEGATCGQGSHDGEAESDPDAADPAAADAESGSATPAPRSTPPPAPLPADRAVEAAARAAAAVCGDQITAVGDSVMLASAPALLERYPGIAIDAEVSRSMWAGPGILQQLADQDALRPYVLVALGTNGAVDHRALEQIAQIVGPDRELVLVDAYAPRDWIDGVNRDLRAFATSRPNVSVAHWHDAIAPRTDLLAGDKVHPGTTGARVYASVVAEGVEHAKQSREAREAQALRDRLVARLFGATD